VLLRAEFPNPDRLLLPGMFVRAYLSQGRSDEALLLPQSAVTRNARGEAVVMVVGADDTVSERVIVVGRVTGNQWIVNSGLVAGEQVVVEGLQKARAGAKVRPMPVGTGASVAPAGPGG
jgi:membrane fusion protein, multidrug efflux system